MTVLITGGTGLIGTALTQKLVSQGHKVHILTRDKSQHPAKAQTHYFNWDIKKGFIDPEALSNVNAVIHLAGANVAEKRWTDARKKEILDSRVKSGQLLTKALESSRHEVKTFISSSAIGWYGENQPGSTAFTEVESPANDFLGQTCYQWEKSTERISTFNIRLVYLRTGIVLSREGGAYAEFRKPMMAGVAPIMGSGQQIISWIHINDIIDLYLFALTNTHLYGVYNAVAPDPVSNKELIHHIRTTKKGIAVPLKAPAFVLKLMLGEMSVEILKSARVSAQKITQAGFVFKFPFISAAVRDLEHSDQHDSSDTRS